MSETMYSDIRTALSQRLETMPGVIAVAWENARFVPTTGVPYLIPSVMWGEAQQAEQGATGRNWEIGVYQITAVYPGGTGVTEINTMAGKIKERFKRGTVLTYNGVYVTVRKVYLNPQTITDAGVRQPISIPFYCQAAN